MANQNKDRVTGETPAQFPTPESRTTPTRPCVIGVCLWASATVRLDCRPSRNKSPLLSLVLDLIRSSGGVQAGDGPDIVWSSFPEVNSALLCAQRIQWAIEGLAEYEAFNEATAVTVVEFADEKPRAAGPQNQDWAQGRTGEGINRGQILLSQSVSELYGEMPGVALEMASEEGYRRWAWSPSQSQASFEADEQAVLQIIAAAGKTDPVKKPARSMHVQPADVSRHDNPNPPAFTLGRAGAARAGAMESPEGKASRMVILLGSLAVLLVGGSLLYFFSHKTPVQNETPVQAVPSAASPMQETRPAKPEPHARQTPIKEPTIAKKAPKSDAKPEPLKQPEVHCDLTPADIQRSLDRAESYMHGGDLTSARAAFQHVVGCPSAREKAQEGLNRIQRMAAQDQ